MEEKNKKILLVCLEVICIATLMPIFYWSALKLLYIPLGKIYYSSSIKPIIPLWLFVILILICDAGWIALMKLCPKSERHAKVIMTLLVLTFSASVLSCFVVLNALEGAF